MKPSWKNIHNSKEEFKIQLIQYLNEDLSMADIGKIYGCSSTAIHNWYKRFGIAGRRQELRDSQYLYQEYIVNKKSMNEISKELNVTYQAVSWYLTKFGITKRPIGEIQKIAQKKYRQDQGEYFYNEHNFCYRMKSRGYVIKYKEYFCMSAAELTMCLILEKQHKRFKTQPFFFEKRLPDILVYDDNLVIEVKCGSNYNKEEYLEYGRRLTNSKGYSYQLIDFYTQYRSEYIATVQFLKKAGAKVGHIIYITEDITT